MQTLKTYIQNNLMTSLLGAIYTLGGFFFILYFMHIDFVPRLNFSDVSYLLIVMFSVGLLFLLLLTMLLVVPALMWLNFQKTLDDILEETQQKKLFLVYLSIDNLFFLLFLVITTYTPDLPYVWYVFGMIYFFSLLVVNRYFIQKFTWQTYGMLFLLGITISVLVGFLFFANTILLEDSSFLNNDSSNDVLAWITLIAGLIVAMGVNLALIVKELSVLHKGLVAIASVMFIALIIGKDGGFISSRVMKNLHLGNFIAKEILVKSEGCTMLARKYPKTVFLEKEGACQINNVLVLSNIGEVFLVEIDNVRLVLLRKDILYYAWNKNHPR